MFEGSSSDSPNTPKNANIPSKSEIKNTNNKDLITSNLKLTFEQFDLNKDGRISKKELQEVMRNLFPNESISKKDIRDMFKVADRDNNGYIDLKGIFCI